MKSGIFYHGGHGKEAEFTGFLKEPEPPDDVSAFEPEKSFCGEKLVHGVLKTSRSGLRVNPNRGRMRLRSFTNRRKPDFVLSRFVFSLWRLGRRK